MQAYSDHMCSCWWRRCCCVVSVGEGFNELLVSWFVVRNVPAALTLSTVISRPAVTCFLTNNSNNSFFSSQHFQTGFICGLCVSKISSRRLIRTFHSSNKGVTEKSVRKDQPKMNLVHYLPALVLLQTLFILHNTKRDV